MCASMCDLTIVHTQASSDPMMTSTPITLMMVATVPRAPSHLGTLSMRSHPIRMQMAVEISCRIIILLIKQVCIIYDETFWNAFYHFSFYFVFHNHYYYHFGRSHCHIKNWMNAEKNQ